MREVEGCIVVADPTLPKPTVHCMQAVFNGAEDSIKAEVWAGRAVDCKKPFERAQFAFIRHAFIQEWQPRGDIEASLVDMLAQCYVGWQYWLSLTFSIANNQDTVIEQKARNKKSERRSYDEGVWQPPRLTASEYLERAYQMADRFNRMFLRTLRQMRDLRRYQVPVTINNPQQVNIAAEGGQQINVQCKGRGSRTGSRKKRPSWCLKPKTTERDI